MEGTVFFSCYCSPRRRIPEFNMFLDTLECLMDEARAPGMGMVVHNNRGSSVVDVMAKDRRTACIIRKSEVLGHSTFSDHRYVSHILESVRRPSLSPSE